MNLRYTLIGLWDIYNGCAKLYRPTKGPIGPSSSDPLIFYRNTIAGSFLGERIIIYFEKIRFAPQKTEFLNFRFLAKN